MEHPLLPFMSTSQGGRPQIMIFFQTVIFNITKSLLNLIQWSVTQP